MLPRVQVKSACGVYYYCVDIRSFCNSMIIHGMFLKQVLTSAILCLPLEPILNGGPVDYGTDVLDGMGAYSFDATGTYTCASGFAPENGSPVTRTCSADTDSPSRGSFDGVEAVCVCKYH